MLCGEMLQKRIGVCVRVHVSASCSDAFRLCTGKFFKLEQTTGEASAEQAH